MWPRARPDSFATGTPHAATSGTAMSETVSPTPPDECLSTIGGPPRCGKTIVSPERTIASVSASISAPAIPRIAHAISKRRDRRVVDAALRVLAGDARPRRSIERLAVALALQRARKPAFVHTIRNRVREPGVARGNDAGRVRAPAAHRPRRDAVAGPGCGPHAASRRARRQPAPTASPAPAPSATPNPFGYVVSPSPAQTGSPRIVEIALNDRVLHAGGMLLVRVTTSPDVTGVIARTWDHAITIPQGSPGYFAGQTQLPAGIPFFLLNRTYQIDFVASTADGRTVTYTLPVRLER